MVYLGLKGPLKTRERGDQYLDSSHLSLLKAIADLKLRIEKMQSEVQYRVEQTALWYSKVSHARNYFIRNSDPEFLQEQQENNRVMKREQYPVMKECVS